MMRCRSFLLPAALAAALLTGPSAFVAAAAERPIVEVTPGKARAFEVAVQGFLDAATPRSETRSDRLRQAIEEALDFSSVLKPLDHQAFLGEERTQALVDGPRGDCSDWRQSGADALVEGEIRGGGEAQPGLLVEYRVWDVARCARLLKTSVQGPKSKAKLSRLGAQLADGIVEAFTGVRGSAATEIAFISEGAGVREIYVMEADGRNARPATRSRSIKAFPDWLPKGDGILYTSYLKGGMPALFVTSRGRAKSGQILKRLMPETPKYRGVFSPDGETLAFVGTAESAADIYTVRRDGRNLRRLTRNGDVIDIAPSWSPDGEQLAFVSDRSGNPQIYVMDADGRNQRRLTYESRYSATPAWSPDGRWIAYGSRAEGQFDIWLIDPSGEVNVPLVVHRRNDKAPTWSPDSRKVAFSSDRRGRPDIYVVDVNGGRVQRLTKGSRDNTSPVWGPYAE